MRWVGILSRSAAQVKNLAAPGLELLPLENEMLRLMERLRSSENHRSITIIFAQY